MKLLFIIDVQNGFINENTQQIPEDIIKHINNYNYDLIIATRFINKVDSLYQTELNMKEMTMLSPKTKLAHGISELADIVIMRSTYTALTEDVKRLLKKNELKQVYLAGLNIESSIMATAFNLFDRDIKPIILSQLCGTVRGEAMKQSALDILEHNIGKDNIL